jgi:hypothetical protein
MVVAALAFAFIVASVIGRGCGGKGSRRSPLNASTYDNLTGPERTSCDAYATAAENFARGREVGASLETHLTAAAVACRNDPTSTAACKGLPKLAAIVHAGKWTAAEAASKVMADCAHYIYP